jgi:2-oxoglutarate ferredoxin oxidoreductase subunit delta
MANITINRDKCKGCLLCISFCPKGAIGVDKNFNRRGVKPAKFSRQSGIPPSAIAESRNEREKAGKQSSACVGCALCAIICPDCCIEVYK